jgi:hypothetical protein
MQSYGSSPQYNSPPIFSMKTPSPYSGVSPINMSSPSEPSVLYPSPFRGSVVNPPYVSPLASPRNSGSRSPLQSPMMVVNQPPINMTPLQEQSSNGSVQPQYRGLTMGPQELPAQISRYSPGTQEFIRRVQGQLPGGQFSPGSLALLQGQQQQISQQQSQQNTRYTPINSMSPQYQQPSSLADLANQFNGGNTSQMGMGDSLPISPIAPVSVNSGNSFASPIYGSLPGSGNSSPQMSPRRSGASSPRSNSQTSFRMSGGTSASSGLPQMSLVDMARKFGVNPGDYQSNAVSSNGGDALPISPIAPMPMQSSVGSFQGSISPRRSGASSPQMSPRSQNFRMSNSGMSQQQQQQQGMSLSDIANQFNTGYY